jgi:hypothetical protein
MGQKIVKKTVTTTGRLRGLDDSITLGLIMFEFYLM